MRAAVQVAVGSCSIREVPQPRPAPGDLVVAVRAAVTCGTDRKILERGHVKLEPPLVMGHEFSGDVVEAGAGAPFRPGDAVMLGLSAPCGACAACLSGATNRCEGKERGMVWGAFAPLVRIPASVARCNVLGKPASLPYESAAMLDPLACVAHGLSRLRRLAGDVDELLVVGVGAVGLLWIAAARRAGIRRLYAAGPGQERRALAERWGAETFEDASAAPSCAAVVECAGVPAAWEAAASRTARGGLVLFFGGCAPGAAVSLSAEQIHYGETTASGSFHYSPADVREAAGWLASGEIDPRPLISGEGGLDEVEEFLAKMARREGIRYLVRP